MRNKLPNNAHIGHGSLLTLVFLKRPTVFSVLCMLIILLGVPVGIYELTQGVGGGALGGLLVLIGVLVALVILLIDRACVYILSGKALNLIELALLLIGISAFSYQERKVFIEVNSDMDYFVLISNNGDFQNSDMACSFPFDKRMKANGKHAVIGSISDHFHQIRLNPPANWRNGHIMKPRKTMNIHVRFYSKRDLNFNEEEIDSLVKKEIEIMMGR